MLRVIRVDGQWLSDAPIALTVPCQLVDPAVIDAMRRQCSVSLEFTDALDLIIEPARCYEAIAECLDILPAGQYRVVWQGVEHEQFEVSHE